MNATEKYNGLNGATSRETLKEIADRALIDGQKYIYKKLSQVLKNHADQKFDVILSKKAMDEAPVYSLPQIEEAKPSEIGEVSLAKAVSPDEIYDMITKKMIAQIKKASGKGYVKKWRAKAYGQGFLTPINYVSKKPYRGINTWLLKDFNPFEVMENPYFFTFKQIEKLGGKLKKGSKGREVVYFTRLFRIEAGKDDEKIDFGTYDRKKFVAFINKNKQKISKITGRSLAMVEEMKNNYIPILKYYNVFNGADVEGIEFDLTGDIPGKFSGEPLPPKAEMPVAEGIVNNFPRPKPKIEHGGNRAYNMRDQNFIKIPFQADFETAQDYYRTLFHELTHCSGDYKHLNREKKGKFGSKDYAFEELIAEFGATFLSAEAGFMWVTNKNHAEYIKGWNKVLTIIEDDNRFIMRAASAAQKAADYILDRNKEGVPAYQKKLKKTVEKTVKEKKEKTTLSIHEKFIDEYEKKHPKIVKNEVYKSLSDSEKYKYIKNRKKTETETGTKKYDFVYETSGADHKLVRTYHELKENRGVKFLRFSDNDAELRNYKLTEKAFEKLKKEYPNYKRFTGSSREAGKNLTTNENLEPQYDLKKINSLKAKYSDRLDKSGVDRKAADFLEKLEKLAKKDVSVRNDFGDWLTGKTGTLELKELLGKVGYEDKKITHFNAFDQLDSLSVKTGNNKRTKPKKSKTTPRKITDKKPKKAKADEQLGLFGSYKVPEKPNLKDTLAFAEKNLIGRSVFVDAINEDVHFTKPKIKKAMNNPRPSKENLALVYKLPEMLTKAVLISEKPDKKKRKEIKKVYKLVLIENLFGSAYRALLTIRKQDKNYYYDHAIIEEIKPVKQNGSVDDANPIPLDVASPILNKNTKKSKTTKTKPAKSSPKGLKSPKTTAVKKTASKKVRNIADQNQSNSDFFSVPGEIGKFFQVIERKPEHSVVITLDGMQGGGKTTFLYHIMDAFASGGNRGVFLSLEEHPDSFLAKEKQEKFIAPQNRPYIDTVGDLDDRAELYKIIADYDVIYVDSWQKLQRMVGAIRLDEDLRKKFDGKVFVIIFQQTTDGRTKGGAEVVFDGDIITKLVKEPKFEDNFAYFDKNRYTRIPLEQIRYNIAGKYVYNPEKTTDVSDVHFEEVSNKQIEKTAAVGKLVATEIL